MSSTTIADLELQVPGRFVALFRLSLIDEIREDASRVETGSSHLAEFYVDIVDADDPNGDEDDEMAKLEIHLADLDSAGRFLSDDHSLLGRVSRHTSLQDLTIRAPFETLHGVLQAMICRAAKDLVEAGEYAPIDGGRVVHRSSAAIWAAGECERLSTEAA
jgi:hypothetical protein